MTVSHLTRVGRSSPSDRRSTLGLIPRWFASARVLRATRVVLDLLVLSAALWIAFALRFDWRLPESSFKQLILTWPWVVGLQYGLLMMFHVPRFSWRYIGLRELRPIVLAVGCASLLLTIVRVLSPPLVEVHGYARYLVVPFGVIFANATLVVLGIAGVRALRRVQCEKRRVRCLTTAKRERTPTILIGAGSAGLLLARELERRPDLAISAVAFADDAAVKRGSIVHGIKVLGSTDELAAIAARTGARQALITIAHLRGEQIRRITAACDAAGLKAKIIPAMHDILGGRVSISQIRDVAIEDLLGRVPIVLDEIQASPIVEDKVVFVTGAGGSIGSELCRQILHSRPRALVLIEQAENSLYDVHRELIARRRATEIVPAIADVCDTARMEQLFRDHEPDIVFHAAAHKHVPMMERNPVEAVKNNAIGTRQVADLAHRYGADRFVLISTDKAVNPTSVMGATKRLAEMYIHALQTESTTRFVSVRFGNVLGSAGSVIPLFREQIAKGGPVTVTHPDMVRYFMTIPEACHLVLEAAGIGAGGELMMLDMGDPVRIRDLAEQMIVLSGLEPGNDIEIEYTGVRPGEKLFEELAFDNEEMLPTVCPRVFVRRQIDVDRWSAANLATALSETVDAVDVRERIRALVPSFEPPEEAAHLAVS